MAVTNYLAKSNTRIGAPAWSIWSISEVIEA